MFFPTGTMEFSERNLDTDTRCELFISTGTERIQLPNLIGFCLSVGNRLPVCIEAGEKQTLTIERISIERCPMVNDNIGWIELVPC